MQRTVSAPAIRRLGGHAIATALSATSLIAAMLLALSIGSVSIAPSEIVGAIYSGMAGTVEGPHQTIIWEVRLPRVFLAAVVGAALAIAGAAYQGLFRNPLADPYLLGAASGAAFGATLALSSVIALPVASRLGVPAAAFTFALLAVLAVVLLARKGRTVPLVPLILAGVVIGSTLSAATSFLLLGAREQASGILAWLLGSFALSSWSKIGAVLPFVIAASAAIALSSRALNLLQLSEEQATQLGLRVEVFKYGLIVMATLATAAAVSVSGVIGFVGLIIPHAVRLAFGPDHRTLVPLSLIWGAGFMVLADLFARSVIAPAELPVGVVTALVGGPLFLYLLRAHGAKP